MTDHADPSQRSPTAIVLDELQLYGWRPFAGEPDPRPLPDAKTLQTALVDIFDALAATLSDTRLEPDIEDLLWSTTNIFHRMAIRVDRELDTNEQAQKRSQRTQDGSEVRSVELEELTAQGISLIERRNAYEVIRDLAADLFEAHLGTTWHPRSGSHTSRHNMIASVIDSRDFLAAKRRTELEPLLPTGPKIAFAGGAEFCDTSAICAALDRVHAKHADMILLHGGSPKGAEKIAARWADNRNCQQIVFKPDWTRHGNAAPFKRNDQLLDTVPIGLIVFPGSGITDNLADKARKMGVPLYDFRPRKAGAS